MIKEKLLLASASPRRKDLLRAAGFDFSILPANVDEWMDAEADPEELVFQNAQAKAMAVSLQNPHPIVLGADTVVVLNERILGKPADKGEAISMLSGLSGKTHLVVTGVALCRAGKLLELFCDRTFVTFRKLDLTEIENYITFVNVMDKAGAYALQEKGECIIQSIDGSRSNVIGLPMEELSLRINKWTSVG